MAATSSSRSSGLRQRISIRRPLGNNSSAEDANVHSAIHSTGEVIILDRNSYNRAGVEIVMGFVTDAEHQRFLDLCPLVEKWITDTGIPALVRLFESPRPYAGGNRQRA